MEVVRRKTESVESVVKGEDSDVGGGREMAAGQLLTNAHRPSCTPGDHARSCAYEVSPGVDTVG